MQSFGRDDKKFKHNIYTLDLMPPWGLALVETQVTTIKYKPQPKFSP